ncbi:MAG: amidohydrolase [Planctomycetaceae bacterium]|nr:amidohydrolase [Planctomycetaceae bacterium]
MSDIVFENGNFTTLDPDNPRASAVAIRDGKFVVVGTREDVLAEAKEDSHTIDLQGRVAIPGLHDSHLHLIRGGLNYNMELRWDGVPSLSDGMRLLRTQVENTPPPQWVRVVGGFTLNQFAEKRLPTLDELNAVAPDTPVFILHLYDRALLNRAALHAIGYTKDSANPPGGEIERDHRGEPTGMLIAKPNATILYAALAKGPKLSSEDQVNSTRQFMRELNRLGVTSAIDAGGGFQNYPDDYAVIEKLARQGELTVRIAYNLFTQHPNGEYADFEAWTQSIPGMDGDNLYRHNGAGEMLVYSAADFEDFRQPRPDMPPQMEGQLEKVVRLLAEKRWPFRLHATYNETIERALGVFEKVNKDIPFHGLHWFFDHAETISDANIDRIAALGGGISIQHRMAYQGEFFVERYGQEAAARTPPIQRMLAAGLPLAAGTDATRVASYNPWVCLYWLVTGKTLGGLQLYGPEERLDRTTALKLYTQGPAWFANTTERGQIKVGQCADFIVPSADYFSIPVEAIRYLTSDLTVLGGRTVYADGDFRQMALPMPQVSPRWSPVKRVPGYHVEKDILSALAECSAAGGCACGECGTTAKPKMVERIPFGEESLFWDSLGCSCWI